MRVDCPQNGERRREVENRSSPSFLYRSNKMKHDMRSLLAKLSLAALPFFSAGMANTIHAATPGDLDPGFNGTGYDTRTLADSATGNGIIADYKNRPVMAYTGSWNPGGPGFTEFAVARYLDTGALDASFGLGGIVVLPLPATDLMCAPEVVEDEAHRLLVATCNPDTIYVWRLKEDGSVDVGYGAGGVAQTTVGTGVFPVIGLTQYKGRAMIASSSRTPAFTDPRFTLVRFTAAGVLDPTLAGTGVARYSIFPASPGTYARATDVKMDSAGRLVLGGRARKDGASQQEFALARVSWGGALDATFGAGGTTHFPVMTGTNYGRRIAFDPQKRILISGTACKPVDPVTGEQNCYVGLARLLTNGALDTSLVGGTGVMAYGGGSGPGGSGFCTDSTFTFGIAVFKDRILLPGFCDLVPPTSGPPYNNIAFVLRLDGNGQYDTSFGYTLNGYTYYDFGMAEAALYGITVDQNGQILTAGRRGKTISDTEQYSEAVAARMVQ
jgi:uncharacterized delta-60 repeat protein